MKNLCSKLSDLIKRHPVYFLGYGVTAVTYFSRYSHEIKEAFGFAGVIYLAMYSAVVGLVSWLYVAARVINSVCS